LFFNGKIHKPGLQTHEHGAALVHGGLTAMATGGARQSVAYRHCRAWELTTEGAKERGHSRDPYRLHGRAAKGWSQAGDEEK
jgi:hypothetical protein